MKLTEQKELTNQLAILAATIWSGKMSHDRSGFGIRLTAAEAINVVRDARTILEAARREAAELAKEEA